MSVRGTAVCLLILCCTGLLPPGAAAQDTATTTFPRELVLFQRSAQNPVFTRGASDAWDAKIRERGWILQDGDRYLLWYTGYDGTRTGIRRLGLATSDDGITWERHPGNPLLPELWVEDMMVVRHDGRFLMFAEGQDDQAQLLSSPDGVRWTRVGRLDVRKADGTPIEPGPYGTPTAWFEDGTWYLFYERRDEGIWLATSDDLQAWANVQDEPVIVPGPATFDRDAVALNQIVKRGGRYYAYYHGAANEPAPRLWACGIAVSDDLIHWEKYAGNPLTAVSENKSSGVVVPVGGGFRFYTMHDRVDLHLPTGR